MNTIAHTLEFETFWDWLLLHPNCILRAGTLTAILCDDDDLHWQFSTEDEAYYVQAIRGKRLIGEIMIEPDPVSYVQVQESDRQGEWIFELIAENQNERYPAYFFVMTHGLDDDEEPQGRAAIH
ncbi:MAG: hypothetical protein AAGK22_25080 [Acidobacteriota bacterium]